MWFLDQHMDASAHGGRALFRMAVGRAGDEQHLRLGLVKQALDLLEHLDLGDLGPDPVPALLRGITDRDELKSGIGLDRRQIVSFEDPAAADNPG